MKPSIDGVINPEDIKKAIEKNKRDCLLISIIHISNIIGTIQDIKEIGHFCKRNRLFIHKERNKNSTNNTWRRTRKRIKVRNRKCFWNSWSRRSNKRNKKS